MLREDGIEFIILTTFLQNVQMVIIKFCIQYLLTPNLPVHWSLLRLLTHRVSLPAFHVIVQLVLGILFMFGLL